MDVGAVLGGDIVLTTPRFELRPLERGDVGALFDHFSDPAVTEFMDIEPLTVRSQAHEIVDWAQGVRADGVGVRWAIRALGGEALIGTCGFNAVVVQRGRRGEIAYDLSRAHWGRGVMAEVLPRMVAFGFEALALRRLEAMVTPGNARSCGLLERHGFQREGVLRGYALWKGAYCDQIVYGRVNDAVD